ncbi:hypothetical protein [Bacillus safensis]|uniref:hypothetical protein n=1 Tax=Bacillus safensis TaxID=561879 RepID=UPI003F59A820
MSIWKTYRYSLLHVLIVFMLFSTSFFTKPNGGKWMLAFMVLIGIVSFSVEYMLNRNTSGQKQDTACKISLFDHVSNCDDTDPVCLFSTRHESFVIKLFLR